MAAKVGLAPRGGAQFGVTAGGMRASGNPIPYILPWATAAGMLLLAVGVRFVLASDGGHVWFWSPMTAAMYATLTFITWRSTRPRGDLTCRLATAGVALGGLLSFYIAGADALTWRPFAVFGLATVAVCGGANVYAAFRHGGGDGQGMHEQLGGALAKVRSINEIQAKDGEVTARYAMDPGVEAAELQNAVGAIASLHGLPVDGVRVLPDRDNANEGELRLNPSNPLRTPTLWLGPSCGKDWRDPTDPYNFGGRRGHTPMQIWLTSDPSVPRNAGTIQATGMMGSGKSVFIQLIAIELLACKPGDAEYWYSNTRKADQEPSWLLAGAARVAKTKKDAAAMLRDLRAESPERARILGEQGLDHWAPGCGIPLRVVFLDEFGDIATDLERVVVDLSETVRSLGIVLVMGLQRASASRIPTDARSNVAIHVCFGVHDETDAAMALPEAVLDAGAAPWLWGTREPGMCYLSAPGVPEEQWAEPGRTHKPNKELMAKWAAFYIARRTPTSAAVAAPVAAFVAPMSPAAVAAAMTPWAAIALHGAAGADATDSAGDDGFIDDDEPDEDFDDEEDLGDQTGGGPVDDVDEREAAAEAADMLRDLADEHGGVDLDTDIDRPKVPADCAEMAQLTGLEPIEVDGGGMRLKLQPKMENQQARDYVRGHLGRMFAAGLVVLKREELGDLLAEVGYGMSWLGKVLKEFCAETPAWIRRTNGSGWYEITSTPTRKSDAT